MAKILFTWELGGGLGHVVPYLGVIAGLQRRGHRVTFALRDPTRASALLAPRGVRCLPAPIRTRPITRRVVLMCTFADILYNCGFDEPDLLRGLVEAWRGLFELTKPDMVVFDHSPTALLFL